jgi:thiol-disulfide isomerase/thioredoxin
VRRRAAVVALAALLSGCAGAGVTPPPAESRVDVDTPELRRAKASARIAACPTEPGGSSDLPGVALACLGGGEAVPLDEVAGPAVLPLWASWCEPCKDELPLYGRLAREAGDRLTVLGVNYQDTQPDLAIDLLRRSEARFPQVADPAGVLAETYRIRGLPGVLWVAEDGTATFANDLVHSYADLASLVSEQVGVAVAEPAGDAG